jgi:hypothetical protein
MEPIDLQVNENERNHMRLLESYKYAVANRLPHTCRDIVQRWSLKPRDALALIRFVRNYPREVVVVETGTFLGVSAFNFASHPKVLEVVSIDPNPSLAELNHQGSLPDPGSSLREVRVLELAETVLDKFPEQRRKVQLRPGTVESVGIPEAPTGTSLLAFVDGDHTREGVAADLRAVFDKDSAAVAILHDCRHFHGPAILAGIASFVEDTSTEYCLRLFEPSSPGLKPPNLGVLYPNALAEEVNEAGPGLLASPKSSLIQAALASWDSWSRAWKSRNRERERADREQERANKQRRRANKHRKRGDRLEAELQKARRPWWRK